MNLVSAGCKLSNCFQQGFNHPTRSSFAVGLVVIIVAVMAVRALTRRRS